MRFYLTSLCTLTLALALPCLAFAQPPKVFFNHVDVTGMRGQSFQNVNVAFDGAGNVQITAEQYSIRENPKVTQAPSPALPTDTGATALELLSAAAIQPTTVSNATTVQSTAAIQPTTTPRLPNLSQATHLVAIFGAPGLFGFSIDIYVNGQFIKSLDQGRAQSSVDISKHLISGNNKIQYRLVASADSGRSSRATVELFLAKQSASQGNAIELSGNYAPLIIKSEEAKGLYEIDIIAP